MFEIQTISYCL